jgi:hypothetical protein
MSALHPTRRVRLLALAAAGLTAATMTAGCTATATVSRTTGSRTTGPHKAAAMRVITQGSSQAQAATAPPRYFLDVVQFSGALSGGQLQVRRSATGALMEQPGSLALGVAPLGHSAFVVAESAGDNSCASRLYRTSISAAGSLRPLTRFGPLLHGLVVSLAAAADGRTIGYFAWPCSKSAAGYLGVLNVRTSQLRRWGDVNVEGSAGDIVACCSLSLSANGKLAIFSGAAVGAGAVITGQRVWTLTTSARAGTLAERSRVVLARPLSGPQLDSVLLSADGRSFYLCTVSTKGTISAHQTATQTSVVTARRTSSGASTARLATLKATGVTFLSEGFGCQIAASPGSRYLLVPYTATYAKTSETGPLVRAARIDVATNATDQISFRLPGTAGMNLPTGISIGW